MMTEAIVNRVALDLSDDFSITIEKNSRVLQFDTIVDTWAYNLSFPRTETNEAAFEHAERFEKRWPGWQEFPFLFYYNGRLLLNGKVKVKYRGGKYEGYAYGTFGTIASSDLAKNMRSLSFPDLSFTNKAEYSSEDPYCVFPLYNPYYYWRRGQEVEVQNTAGETVTTWLAYKKWLQTQGGKMNNFDEATSLFVLPDGGTNLLAVISPFMFFWYMFEQLFSNFGVEVKENALKTNDELKKSCMFTSYNIATVDVVQTIETIIAEVDFGEDVYTDIYSFEYIFGPAMTDFNPAKLLPEDWSVKDYLLGVQNLLNVMLDFSDKDATVKIIDREGIFSQPAESLQEKLVAPPELEPESAKRVVLKFGIDPNDVLWKDNYKELTAEQWKRYKGDQLNYAALAAVPTKKLGDIYYCTEEYQYREYQTYEVEVDNAGTMELHEQIDWVPLSMYGQPYTAGNADDSETIIESRFGVVSGKAGTKMLLTGNCEKYQDEVEPFVPRIMFYHGLVNGIPNGEQFAGNIEARWRGDKGLYEKRWKHTVQALKDGIPGVAYFDFDEVDFERLNLNKKFSVEEGEFLIEKSTTTFHLDRVGITEAQIVKLP